MSFVDAVPNQKPRMGTQYQYLLGHDRGSLQQYIGTITLSAPNFKASKCIILEHFSFNNHSRMLPLHLIELVITTVFQAFEAAAFYVHNGENYKFCFIKNVNHQGHAFIFMVSLKLIL